MGDRGAVCISSDDFRRERNRVSKVTTVIFDIAECGNSINRFSATSISGIEVWPRTADQYARGRQSGHRERQAGRRRRALECRRLSFGVTGVERRLGVI